MIETTENHVLLAKLYEDNGNDYDFDYPEGDYKLIDEGDWIDDGKYSYKETIVQFNGEYFLIQESRSGSYFSYYHYGTTYIYKVERKEETKVVVSWPVTGKSIEVSERR